MLVIIRHEQSNYRLTALHHDIKVFENALKNAQFFCRIRPQVFCNVLRYNILKQAIYTLNF